MKKNLDDRELESLLKDLESDRVERMASDRVEIMNPDGPFGQATRENFGKAGITDYRNPHWAEVMNNRVALPLAEGRSR